MNYADPTKTITRSDQYPAVGGMVLAYTYTPEPPEIEAEEKMPEEKPNWLLYYTVLWVALTVISAFFAFDQGWIARQTELDAAAQKARSLYIPIDQVTTKP